MNEDREVSKKKIEVSLDNSTIKIVHNSAGETHEEKVALIEEVASDVLSILNKDTQKNYDVIVDFVPLGKKGVFLPSGARSMAALMMSNKQIKKWAVVSKTKIMKVTLGFVSKLAGKKNTKWFSDKEKALQWIKAKA